MSDLERIQAVLALLAAAIPLFIHVWRVDRADLADRAAGRGVYARGPGCTCHPHLACSCGAPMTTTTITTGV
jgi:hypothetical protein